MWSIPVLLSRPVTLRLSLVFFNAPDIFVYVKVDSDPPLAPGAVFTALAGVFNAADNLGKSHQAVGLWAPVVREGHMEVPSSKLCRLENRCKFRRKRNGKLIWVVLPIE